jgi:purine-binding chemotaxis protein CheW
MPTVSPSNFVVFLLSGQRYALPLEVVDRIVRAAEVTPLPEAPAGVLGMLDVQGSVLPVLDLRRKLGLQPEEITPSDQFLIARTSRRQVVLPIAQALGVMPLPDSGVIETSQVAPSAAPVKGVVQFADGLVLLQDVERLLSLDEEQQWIAALREEAAHAT